MAAQQRAHEVGVRDDGVDETGPQQCVDGAQLRLADGDPAGTQVVDASPLGVDEQRTGPPTTAAASRATDETSPAAQGPARPRIVRSGTTHPRNTSPREEEP